MLLRMERRMLKLDCGDADVSGGCANSGATPPFQRPSPIFPCLDMRFKAFAKKIYLLVNPSAPDKMQFFRCQNEFLPVNFFGGLQSVKCLALGRFNP